MTRQDWFNYLEHDVRIRVDMTTDTHGQVTVFTAQLELLIVDDTWVPLARYDTAHGQAHLDLLNPRGETYDKVWLGFRAPFNEAFTIAEKDLKRSYREHIARFYRQLEGSKWQSR